MTNCVFGRLFLACFYIWPFLTLRCVTITVTEPWWYFFWYTLMIYVLYARVIMIMMLCVETFMIWYIYVFYYVFSFSIFNYYLEFKVWYVSMYYYWEGLWRCLYDIFTRSQFLEFRVMTSKVSLYEFGKL